MLRGANNHLSPVRRSVILTVRIAKLEVGLSNENSLEILAVAEKIMG